MDPDPLPARVPAGDLPGRERSLALLISIVLALGCATLLLLPDLWLRGQRLAPNCHVEGVAVGGLSGSAATRLLARRFAINRLTVRAADQSLEFDLIALGGEPQIEQAVARVYAVGRSGGQLQRLADLLGCWRAPRHFPLQFAFADARLLPALRKVAWGVNRLPVNASLQLADDRLTTLPERAGARLEVAATATRIREQYSLRATTIEAEVKHATPRIRAADLAAVNTPLVTFSTWYRTGEGNRSRNIRRCAESLNGRVLMPGDTFSFNKLVGDRTRDRGFLLAGMFVNGEKVQGYGGGVCQVSSTVYNAARNADLQILERHPHSLPVGYVPEGRDATVAYPYSDFKFRNSSDTPLFIQATAKGGRLTVRLWGRADARIDRSDVTARLRVVKYPERKKPVVARTEDAGASAPSPDPLPPPAVAPAAGAIN